jgi:hypothetical protein
VSDGKAYVLRLDFVGSALEWWRDEAMWEDLTALLRLAPSNDDNPHAVQLRDIADEVEEDAWAGQDPRVRRALERRRARRARRSSRRATDDDGVASDDSGDGNTHSGQLHASLQ